MLCLLSNPMKFCALRSARLAQASIHGKLQTQKESTDMKNEALELVHRWFDGLNRGDLPSLVALFSPAPRIRNAANPPVEGPNAARSLLEEFFQRTCARQFDLIATAENGDQVFAAWKGELTFPPGTRIADVTLAAP